MIYNTQIGRHMLINNVTAKEIAKACGVCLKTAYNWINNGHKPKDVKQLTKLANVLNVEVEELEKVFNGDD